MRFACAALLALCLPVPAYATGGLLCRPVDGTGPTLSLVVGHGDGGGIVGANLTESGRTRSTFEVKDRLAIGRSWIDGERIWLDLVDADVTPHQLELRAAFQPKLRFRPALGTMTRGGRSWKVRCEEA